MTGDQDEEGFLRLRTVADPVQELHRVRRVHQRGEPRLMTGGDQQARGDADAFMDVVIFAVFAFPHAAAALGEDADQPGRGFHIGLVGIGADRGEGIQPFFPCAA